MKTKGIWVVILLVIFVIGLYLFNKEEEGIYLGDEDKYAGFDRDAYEAKMSRYIEANEANEVYPDKIVVELEEDWVKCDDSHSFNPNCKTIDLDSTTSRCSMNMIYKNELYDADCDITPKKCECLKGMINEVYPDKIVVDYPTGTTTDRIVPH